MALCQIDLDLPPRSELVAATLAPLAGAFWLCSAGPSACSYLGAEPLEWVDQWDPEPGLVAGQYDEPGGHFPRWVGLLPYEACRDQERGYSSDARPRSLFGRPRWYRYGAVARVDQRVQVVGDHAPAVADLARRLVRAHRQPGKVVLRPLDDQEDAQVHEHRIRRALGEIAAGNLYQVNLARRFGLEVRGRALDLSVALGRKAQAPFGFALQTEDAIGIVGCSPELCLSLSSRGQLLTRPIKGTRPRGRNAAEDAALIQELRRDPKERAELSMVIDLERNDLGRVARTGRVRVRSRATVETYPTLHHNVATVEAELRPEVSREELIRIFLPSGSVTGAPKRAAMELIASLEASRRGLYTGAYGYLSHDGSLRLAMAIRTVLAEGDGRGSYFAGGGIVADSNPASEVEETLWKSSQVLIEESRSGDWAELVQEATGPNVENWAIFPHRGTPGDEGR